MLTKRRDYIITFVLILGLVGLIFIYRNDETMSRFLSTAVQILIFTALFVQMSIQDKSIKDNQKQIEQAKIENIELMKYQLFYSNQTKVLVSIFETFINIGLEFDKYLIPDYSYSKESFMKNTNPHICNLRVLHMANFPYIKNYSDKLIEVSKQINQCIDKIKNDEFTEEINDIYNNHVQKIIIEITKSINNNIYNEDTNIKPEN